MSAPATEHAAAVAGQALHDVEHGDNDPAATAELQVVQRIGVEFPGEGIWCGARITALLSMAALNIQRGAVEQGTAAELGIGGRRG